MVSNNNKKSSTLRQGGEVISIDHLLDIKMQRDEKIRKIKELVNTGRYRVESEKLSKILSESVFSDNDTPSRS